MCVLFVCGSMFCMFYRFLLRILYEHTCVLPAETRVFIAWQLHEVCGEEWRGVVRAFKHMSPSLRRPSTWLY